MRTLFSIGACLFTLGAALPAKAQTFGQAGDVSLGAERVFGLHSTTVSSRVGPRDARRSATRTTFGIGWHGDTSPFNRPRIGVDVFVIDQLSVGGSLAFFVNSGDRGVRGRDSAILFAPRVGYALMFSDVAGFWPRGGLTYWTENDPDRDQLALSLEGMFVIFPAPRFGFHVGPVVDIGFAGDAVPAPFDARGRERSFGVALGVNGFF